MVRPVTRSVGMAEGGEAYFRSQANGGTGTNFPPTLVATAATISSNGRIVLKFSPYLFRMLGRTGLNLLSRVMGIVLTAVGVQFVLVGGAEAWKQLFH